MFIQDFPTELLKSITKQLSSKEYVLFHATCKSLKRLYYPFNAKWKSWDFFRSIEYGMEQVSLDMMKFKRFNPLRAIACFGMEAPLSYASRMGRYQIVQALLRDQRVDPTSNDHEPLRRAAYYGNLEIVQLLLDDIRVIPHALDDYALRCSSLNGHYSVVQFLLRDPRVNPQANENEAIRMAVLKGWDDIILLLLQDDRVNPSDRNNEAILTAARLKRGDIVRMLLRDTRVVQGLTDTQIQQLHREEWDQFESYWNDELISDYESSP
ncbi:hypothetical protein EDD86DRAFT_276819 [Gorgonomyces haynaldii]|nr:hypothetical protein EDD86DRAFT_276819 [Gorgonomyces haynaldii]